MKKEFAKLIGRGFWREDELELSFSGSGIEFAVSGHGGEGRLLYHSEQNQCVAVLVDSYQTLRAICQIGEGEIAFPIPSGEHRVRIVRETQFPTTGGVLLLKDFVFEGDFLPAPAPKKHLIEFAGDSISCGDGALGTFTPEGWRYMDDSALSGYACQTARILDADYSIVARGGIGLLAPIGGYTLPQLYDYYFRYRNEMKYDFPRKPDLIVIELGANDSVRKYPEEQYQAALADFIAALRARHGSIPLVWIGKNEGHFASALALIDRLGENCGVYALRHVYGASGSGPKVLDVGHPNAAEHLEMAEAIADFIRAKGLLQ